MPSTTLMQNPKLGQQLVLPRNALTGEEKTPRLTLRKRDQKFFQKHVLKGESISDPDKDKIYKEQDAPKQRIAENIRAIDDFIDEHNFD